MLLRPLLYTAFLLDDFVADNGRFGASTVVLSSASSKTAAGTAFFLAERGDVEVVGLTSAGNVSFVERLGVYGRVVTRRGGVTAGGSGGVHRHRRGRGGALGRPLALRRRPRAQLGRRPRALPARLTLRVQVALLATTRATRAARAPPKGQRERAGAADGPPVTGRRRGRGGGASASRRRPTARAASDGQIVLPSPRLRRRVRTAAPSRSRSAASSRGSHHGRPRSPSATLASWVRGRSWFRRAAMSSFTSSARSGSGIDGSVRRHRRPFTTKKRSSTATSYPRWRLSSAR